MGWRLCICAYECLSELKKPWMPTSDDSSLKGNYNSLLIARERERRRRIHFTTRSQVCDPNSLRLELTYSRSSLAWQTASGKSSGLHWFPQHEYRRVSSRTEQQLKRRLRPGDCRGGPGQDMFSSLMENRNVKNQNKPWSYQLNIQHHRWREFNLFNASFKNNKTGKAI